MSNTDNILTFFHMKKKKTIINFLKQHFLNNKNRFCFYVSHFSLQTAPSTFVKMKHFSVLNAKNLSGNTVWHEASASQKLTKIEYFDIFNQLLSNVKVARFAHNIEWDVFYCFQTLWVVGLTQSTPWCVCPVKKLMLLIDLGTFKGATVVICKVSKIQL